MDGERGGGPLRSHLLLRFIAVLLREGEEEEGPLRWIHLASRLREEEGGGRGGCVWEICPRLTLLSPTDFFYFNVEQ